MALAWPKETQKISVVLGAHGWNIHEERRDYPTVCANQYESNDVNSLYFRMFSLKHNNELTEIEIIISEMELRRSGGKKHVMPSHFPRRTVHMCILVGACSN